MKSSCRIIVSKTCNYDCSYCCNKIPEVIEKFTPVSLGEMIDKLADYRDVCITGGEPCLGYNYLKTLLLATAADFLGKKVYLYTNGSYRIGTRLTKFLDGINVGYHSSQIRLGSFVENVRYLVNGHNIPVRIQVRDTDPDLAQLKTALSFATFRLWTLNECDKTEIEDWYIIK